VGSKVRAPERQARRVTKSASLSDDGEGGQRVRIIGLLETVRVPGGRRMRRVTGR